MLQLQRTDSSNPNFRELVKHLDAELAQWYGAEQAFYAQFNKVDAIKQVVVAYEDATAVSCGAIRPVSEGVMEIKRMYTLPERRGRGIAAKLLAELERWAAELGSRQCLLETGKKQPEAIHLYIKSGYSPIPNYGQYEGKGYSVCFAKDLTG